MKSDTRGKRCPHTHGSGQLRPESENHYIEACICRVGQKRKYTPYNDCIFGDFPAKITVYKLYVHGSGKPYVFVKIATSLSWIWGRGCKSVSCKHIWIMTSMNDMLICITRCASLGLARTVSIHRIWPYVWWVLCQNYRIYTVHIWLWPTLCTIDSSSVVTPARAPVNSWRVREGVGDCGCNKRSIIDSSSMVTPARAPVNSWRVREGVGGCGR